MNTPSEDRLWRQCVALAGALAEAGVQLITLTTPDGNARALPARQTDLPAVLLNSTVGTSVEVEAIGLRVTRGTNELVASRAGMADATVIAELVRRAGA